MAKQKAVKDSWFIRLSLNQRAGEKQEKRQALEFNGISSASVTTLVMGFLQAALAAGESLSITAWRLP